MKRDPFTIMVKPVGPRCNLGCSYCYYLDTDVVNDSEACMTDEVLEAFIRQYIETHPGPVIQFTWHGGEPTLAGLEFYRRVVSLQKRYLPAHWTCWNNLQTNGMLLDDAWCAFLAENRFDIGLSIDGHQQVHDAYRHDLGGAGTYQRVAATIQRLKKHGLKPDLLCTVTSRAAEDPLAVYRSLRGFQTGWVQFIPIVMRTPDGVSESSVNPDDYGRFLCDIFDDWILNDLGHTDVQLFAEAAMTSAGGQANLCWLAPTCGRALVVERDGSVYACDHFVDAEHRLGNLMEHPLADLIDLPFQQRFGEAKRDGLTEACRTCPWLSQCHGGCPKDRFVKTTDILPQNYLCDGLRRFFAYAEDRLRTVMTLRQQGATPEAMKAHFREALKHAWRGVGPNDPCPCGSSARARDCCWHKRPSAALRR